MKGVRLNHRCSLGSKEDQETLISSWKTREDSKKWRNKSNWLGRKKFSSLSSLRLSTNLISIRGQERFWSKSRDLVLNKGALMMNREMIFQNIFNLLEVGKRTQTTKHRRVKLLQISNSHFIHRSLRSPESWAETDLFKTFFMKTQWKSKKS